VLVKLLIASMIVRALAILIGLRKAPRSWLFWAIVYELFEVSLWICHVEHWIGPHGWYVQIYTVEQPVSVALLTFVVWRTVAPVRLLVAFSIAASASVSSFLWVAVQYPDSPIEPVMYACGAVLLALGFMAGVTTWADRSGFRVVLSMYLLLFAVLMLVGGEFLTSPGLDRAIALLDCLAFSAWGILWAAQKRRAVPED
jgi:hypothetical protein